MNSQFFMGKNGHVLSIVGYLSAKMRLYPIAAEIPDGLKVTVPSTNSSDVHLLNILMLQLSFDVLPYVCSSGL